MSPSARDITSSLHTQEHTTGVRSREERVSKCGALNAPRLPERGLHEPPDGGPRAWLVVCGAFFVWFNSWGAINGFGVFMSYYQLELLPSYSASDIAWIGSVQNFLVLFIGSLSGPLCDAGYGSYLLAVGGLINVLGTMALSFASEYYQVFLSQGICVGLGWGLMFTPAALLPARFFRRRLPLATGIASAGTGIGGIVYSIVFSMLVKRPDLGFPGAVRVLGLLVLTTSLFSTIAMTGSGMTPSKRCRQFVDWTAFTEVSFNAYLIGGVFTMIGLSAPYYYANLYAIETRITSAQLGFYVVAAMNAGSLFGRLVSPFLALRAGVFNTFILAYIASAATCFCLIAARGIGPIFAIATLYGFSSGAVVALSPVTIIRMTSDPELIGTRMGMSFALPSVGVLIGSPICGAILQSTGSFTTVWLFSGACLVVGTACMTGCRIAQTGLVLRKNV
ncbi:MFS monocarboxylate transporter like protein [Zymoseptoria brevis]|uniref:MFS monocarboxylate transporter like protein n=1 Tax=Zymoseptoria brevis TaxID=1047168 RepID=A0A0F4GSY4_9PEZI|nr:MFS monocarboxylate transporter like protein [Zymoseptoria brevis]